MHFVCLCHVHYDAKTDLESLQFCIPASKSSSLHPVYIIPKRSHLSHGFKFPVLDPIKTPKDVHNRVRLYITLHGKRDFADMVKDLKMGRLSEIIWVRIRERDAMTEARVLIRERELQLLPGRCEDGGVAELRRAGSL